MPLKTAKKREPKSYHSVVITTKNKGKMFLTLPIEASLASDGKASVCNAGDPGSIPGLGRSPGEGNGGPLQYSCLENPMDLEPGRLPSMGSQRVGHD